MVDEQGTERMVLSKRLRPSVRLRKIPRTSRPGNLFKRPVAEPAASQEFDIAQRLHSTQPRHNHRRLQCIRANSNAAEFTDDGSRPARPLRRTPQRDRRGSRLRANLRRTGRKISGPWQREHDGRVRAPTRGRAAAPGIYRRPGNGRISCAPRVCAAAVRTQRRRRSRGRSTIQ